MADNKKLIEELRNKHRAYVLTANPNAGQIFLDAADAIESLQSELRTCRNELCLRCGSYVMKHQGACDDCRWENYG